MDPTPASTEKEIRRDERRILADLLEEHAAVIGSFAVDTEATVRLIAFMLRLPRDDTQRYVIRNLADLTWPPLRF